MSERTKFITDERSSDLEEKGSSNSEAHNESHYELNPTQEAEAEKKEDDPSSVSGNPHLKEIDSRLQRLTEELDLDGTRNSQRENSIDQRKEIFVLLNERFLVSQALSLKLSKESGEELRTTISEVYRQLEKLEGERNRGFVEKISDSLPHTSLNDLALEANKNLLELLLDQTSEENERILFHEISQLVEKDLYSCFFWILKLRTLLESNRIKGIVDFLAGLLSKCFQEVENYLQGKDTELLSLVRLHQVEAIAEHASEGDKGKLFTDDKFKGYAAGLIKHVALEENSLLQFQRTFGLSDSQGNLGRCLELRKILEEVLEIYESEESLDLLKKYSSLSESSTEFISNLMDTNERKLRENALARLENDSHESIKKEQFKQFDLLSSQSIKLKEVFAKFKADQTKIDFLLSLLPKTRLMEALPILDLLIETVQAKEGKLELSDCQSKLLSELLLNTSIIYLNFMSSDSSLVLEILTRVITLLNILISKSKPTESILTLLEDKEYSTFVI